MIRIFDFLLSLIAIIILFPFSIPLIFFLKFSGEGEIFFTQKRVGINGKSFNLIKFATMLKNSPSIGSGLITIKNDPRILPYGHFLRRSKINELPQLINIFRGDMSFIGPRPLTLEGYNSYPNHLQPKLKLIKPGLSGLTSLILRNEEEILSKVTYPKEFHSNILAPFKAETEVWYSYKRNLANHLLLIFLTIVIVLIPKTKILSIFFKGRPKMSEELKAIIDNE